jgi:hypothetical protein
MGLFHPVPPLGRSRVLHHHFLLSSAALSPTNYESRTVFFSFIFILSYSAFQWWAFFFLRLTVKFFQPTNQKVRDHKRQSSTGFPTPLTGNVAG